MVNNFIISLVSFMIFIYICQLFFEFQGDFANLIAVCFLAMLANACVKVLYGFSFKINFYFCDIFNFDLCLF